MANNCPHCTAAAAQRHYGRLQAKCRGCQTREIANGVAFFEARAWGAMTEKYRAQLRAVFGDDWQAGHGLVKAEAARLAAMG